MDKKEAYIKFIEAKMYLDERDGSCNYANDLRRKYPEFVGVVNIADVYRRIVNYRVKKYGTSRIGYTEWDLSTYEEKMKAATNFRNRKRRRRNTRC